MSIESPAVQTFFEQYARSRTEGDVEFIASQYSDPFMIADPNGARVVDKAALLAVFPKGFQLLKTHGHTSTTLRSLRDTAVDEHYRFVRAQFLWRFEKPAVPPIDVDVDASFMVYVSGGAFSIVFQQEREDFRDACRSRGIELARP